MSRAPRGFFRPSHPCRVVDSVCNRLDGFSLRGGDADPSSLEVLSLYRAVTIVCLYELPGGRGGGGERERERGKETVME